MANIAKIVESHSKMSKRRGELESQGYTCSRGKPDSGMSMKLVCKKDGEKVAIQHR